MRVFLLARFSGSCVYDPSYSIDHGDFRSLGIYDRYEVPDGTECHYGRHSWWSKDDMHVELKVKRVYE